MTRFLPRLFLAAFLFATFSGCGLVDYFMLPAPEDTARELYDAGFLAMNQKEYYKAIDYFTKLKDRYPFSPYTPRAEMALADAYYLNKDYKDSVSAYKEFEELHPRYEEMPYVLFQIGMANLKTFSTFDRPLPRIQEALRYFYRLRERYPDSEYAAKAEEHIHRARTILAKRELFVADFYWKSKKYGASWRRYDYVIRNFPDLPDAAHYARDRGNLAYLKHQAQESERLREEKQGSWKDWFDWL